MHASNSAIGFIRLLQGNMFFSRGCCPRSWFLASQESGSLEHSATQGQGQGPLRVGLGDGFREYILSSEADIDQRDCYSRESFTRACQHDSLPMLAMIEGVWINVHGPSSAKDRVRSCKHTIEHIWKVIVHCVSWCWTKLWPSQICQYWWCMP